MNKLAQQRTDLLKKRLSDEQEKNARRQAEIQAKNTPPAPEPEVVAEETSAVVAEEGTTEQAAPASTEEGQAP